jgi:enterochelin esterase-like enzyme
MPAHNFEAPWGRIETITIDSKALTNNVLGDPTIRQVAVYLPEGYDDNADREYPVFVDIVGFTASGFAHIAWKGFGESVPQRVDRLIQEGKMGPVIVALPDCFTSLGGNQYINSSAMGNWADFLCLEMLPALEARFRVRKGSAHRALFGKSSGGYGAIAHGLRYGEHWGAIACHSGDMFFDWCYRNEMPRILMALAAHDMSIESIHKGFRSARKTGGQSSHILMMLAMAATYDPDPALPGGIRLPVDLETCEMIDERWQAWLAHDPIHMIDDAACQSSLKRLKGIYIDCGTSDQFLLLFGARILTRKLTDLAIEHRFEEFADNHSAVDYRMDESLPFLYRAIA